MGKNWHIGSLFGIPLYLDTSWFLIFALVTLTNAQDIQTQGLTAFPWLGWLAAAILALLLFVSVLLHELGHSLVAKKQGIQVNSITLFLFGGLASIDRESTSPQAAFNVAIAGPAVSFALFAVFFSLQQLWTANTLLGYMSQVLGQINLILALFNLIPGLPLDGGQVLKALVWQMTGDRYQGIHWAALTGQWLGGIGICLGLFAVFLGGEISGLWLALIGWFIVRNAAAYDRVAQMQASLLKLTAEEVMTKDFRVLDAHLTLEQFTATAILYAPATLYYAASEGRYRGFIQTKDLQTIERSQWAEQTLLDIAHPLTNIPSVEEKTPLVEVIQKLETVSEYSITVLSPAGAVAGIIDRGDIVRSLAEWHNLPIPATEIQRIKREGSYPPYLPLNAIAKNL
jgi:Zn-dependent protease